MAVTKRVAPELIREAFSAGQTLFGENYVQETREKLEALEDLHPCTTWHLIGYLQSNKARLAVQLFDCVQTLDRPKLAKALDHHAADAGRVLPVFVQVNVAEEATKSGLAPDQVRPFLEQVAELSHIRVKGLMAIPPWTDDPECARPHFRALRELRDAISARPVASVELDELSMGMSHDFEVAIEEGATLIRVGTAIFGHRA